MRNLFRKSSKVTAETARRVTGISTPVFGVSWSDPGPSETEIVRRFLVFLEDRRVLYNPFDMETEAEVGHSIHQIREEGTKTLQALSADAFAVVPLRAIRDAGRRFHDEQHEDYRHFDYQWRGSHARPAFFVALGAFRATVGHQVAALAGRYGIDVEGPLASIIPTLGEASQLADE
ncbi:hypothetical protein JQK88_20220 [Mesorhizobium caraganae]|uniref:DUF6650 family protein n=1 Tax=Mesorhizobium caraganae TaxID=483206 RepID=UPI00193A9544|nr:DUF6650 family protein [Mesorhizobium caraganae]MBM2713502.1 hypothetical protein [Mesorhizobium caraganae]